VETQAHVPRSWPEPQLISSPGQQGISATEDPSSAVRATSAICTPSGMSGKPVGLRHWLIYGDGYWPTCQ
jgi:hypothetical protein